MRMERGHVEPLCLLLPIAAGHLCKTHGGTGQASPCPASPVSPLHGDMAMEPEM